MDDLVRAALAKWPNVPDCYGWLALDARGQWRLGEERQTITHPAMNAFISRNYGADEAGRFRFQNGPQRVFVDLDYLPWVWRLVPSTNRLSLSTHTGVAANSLQHVWLDDAGRFVLQADGLTGGLHDHDAAALLDLLVDESERSLPDQELSARLVLLTEGQQAGLRLAWEPGPALHVKPLRSRHVEDQFKFVAHPKPAASA